MRGRPEGLLELLRHRRHRLSTSKIHGTIIFSTLSYSCTSFIALLSNFWFLLNFGRIGGFEGTGERITFSLHHLDSACRVERNRF